MEKLNFVFSTIITLSVLVVIGSIAVDFILYSNKSNVKRSKKSLVATGTMFMFYFLYYNVIRFNIGDIVEVVSDDNVTTVLGCVFVGTLCIVVGAITSVLGRLALKNNWADHIKIYDEHTLVNKGVYKIVRHPLYSSLMLMFFGGSIAYMNYLSAVLTTFVFIPFMYYRAKQEEKLLLEEFAEYKEYRENVGMFFPKIKKGGV